MFKHFVSLNFEVTTVNETPSKKEVYDALKQRFDAIPEDEVLGNVEIYDSEDLN